MCVMASQVTQHTEMILHSSEIVKHVSEENLNKSSYISTMIIHVNTAEIAQTNAGDSAEKAIEMYERIKEL